MVVQNLIAQGVRRVFVIPGGQGWGLEAGWEGAGWGARSRPLTTPVEAGPCPSCDRVRLRVSVPSGRACRLSEQPAAAGLAALLSFCQRAAPSGAQWLLVACLLLPRHSDHEAMAIDMCT